MPGTLPRMKPTRGAVPNRSHPLMRGLAAWWPFWEGTGGTVYDISGNSNHGTLTNMDPATDWVPGRTGHALDFDGTNDYVDVGTDPTNIPRGASGDKVTTAVWINLDTYQSNTAVVSYTDNWEIRLESASGNGSGGYIWFRTFGDNNGGTTSELVQLDQWAHIAIVWEAGVSDGAQVYFNGSAVNSNSTINDTSNASGKTFFIAESLSTNVSTLDGQIANVLIEKRAWSPAEVRQAFLNPWGPFEDSQYPAVFGTTAAPAATVGRGLTVSKKLARTSLVG